MSLGPKDAAAMVRIDMAQHDYQIHRDKYERLRSDVTIKLKFLDENKVCGSQFFFISFPMSAYLRSNSVPPEIMFSLISSGLNSHLAVVMYRFTSVRSL